MKFKEHATAGTIVAATTTVALGFELLVFPVTLFFSLFPDLDTSSIPQRWCYRVVTVALAFMAYHGLYQEAVTLAIVAMLPLLDHHRGWTHRLWAPIAFPAIVLATYNLIVLHVHPFDIQWEEQIIQHWKLLVGLVVGWYTHLFLDRKKRPHTW